MADRRLVRVRESLYFHALALADIQETLVAYLKANKEIGPSDIKDLLGVSRKYAIPCSSTSTPSASRSGRASTASSAALSDVGHCSVRGLQSDEKGPACDAAIGPAGEAYFSSR